MSSKIEEMQKKLLKILRIHQIDGNGFDIDRLLTHDENCAKNRIWYDGDSFELSQLFSRVKGNGFSFWSSMMTQGMEIRKIHIPMPKLLVDTINNVCIADYNDIDFTDNEQAQELWEEISEENNFKSLLKKAMVNAVKTQNEDLIAEINMLLASVA